MLPLVPLFVPLGLFLPGFFLARYLRIGLTWASAFVISLLVLFHAVFWLGVCGAPIKLWTVALILMATSAGAFWLQRGSRRPAIQKGSPWTLEDRALLLLTGIVGIVVLLHSATSPLMGADTLFRWDFLAQKLLALGKLDFYPPLAPADFRTYFFVDGIPPLVSFTNWWFYASAGEYLPWLVCVFVAAQFACTLAFTYGAAAALFSRRGGVIAAAALAGSPLYFRSVVLGQETGLTALAVAALLYFVVTAEQGRTAAIVPAALAAALCALSREYGWIAVIAGAVAILWRRHPWKQAVVFAGVAAAVAGPWYARNWIRTGNPLYSLRFLGFPVNPIHDRILQYYNASLGLQHWTAANWISVAVLLASLAIFPVLAGIPGGFLRFRERGYLIVIALLLAAVWIQSIGYTSGGVEISTRVLSPALVVLSITAAGMIEPLTRRARWGIWMIGALAACQLWTAAQGAYWPGLWSESAFPRVAAPLDFQLRDQLANMLPAGARVLSDSAYLHAALDGKGIDVVPVWSPEVRFLFSSSPEESERQLRSLGITNVAVYPQTLNLAYLASASSFFATLPQRWQVRGHVGNYLFVMTPKNP